MTIFAKCFTISDKLISKVYNITKAYSSIPDISYERLIDLNKEFYDHINGLDALEYLENKDGIISFDYEHDERINFNENIVLSAAVFNLVNSVFFTPAFEPNNKLPYTIFKSSTENISSMKEAGVKFYTPDSKLGYHNDVFINDDKYFIPKYVSLINLFIGYEAPGNFYYINFDIWEEFEDIFCKGIDKRFKFKPTPIVYESRLGKDQKEGKIDQWVEVPAFWKSDTGQKFVFSNGELKDSDESGLILNLKNSLLNNPKKIAVPQKTNRVTIFRNDIGFHSRDIFKEQVIFDGITRLFLRAVSEKSILIPTQ